MTELAIPGYTIKRTLGRGGMATVYLAEQDKVGREVALKVMAPALSADIGFRDRFLREARIGAHISHPHVVTVYDANEVNGIYYIAMEFHAGGDLKARLRDGLGVRGALQVAREVARALDFAHSKGYLHRDIKPDNILFRSDGGAVLTDFGIARATGADAGLTQAGMVAGTPRYMSPEQARAQRLDATSDLYSLGAVLFEMLTGRVPFEASDPVALGIMHVNAPVPRLEGRLAHFQPLIDRLLGKLPAQRPQSGAQVVREIDALEKTFDAGIGEAAEDVKTPLPSSLRSEAPVALAAGAGNATVFNPAAAPAVYAAAAAVAAGTAPTPAPVPPGPAGKVAVVVALLAVLGGGGGWWMWRHSDADARAATLQASLDAAAAALASDALVAPDGANALAHYRAVLARDPGNPLALAGIRNVVNALQAKAYAALDEQRIDQAARLLAQASEIDPAEPGHVALQRAISEARRSGGRSANAKTAAKVAP